MEFVIDQNILRLQVTMNYSLIVEEIQATEQMVSEDDDLIFVQVNPVADFLHFLAEIHFTGFHNKENAVKVGYIFLIASETFLLLRQFGFFRWAQLRGVS